MKLISIALCFLFLFSCKKPLDVDYIKSTGWSHDKGYTITDFINFKQGLGYSLNGDTIFFENKPRAIITSLDKKGFDLTIRSLDGKDIGHYMDEREMSQ
jgi:hypothetical protein